MKLRKTFIYTFMAASLLSMSSCLDKIAFGSAFLEKAPGGDVTKDTVFGNPDYARRFLWQTYTNMYYGLPTYWDGGVQVKLNTGMFEILSDCWHSHNSWDDVTRQYYSGAHVAGNVDKFDYLGEKVWEGVRASWIFINSIDATPDMKEEEKARLKGEAKCIIASRYFDMFRHYGGLPIEDKDYTGTEPSYDLPRASVEETVNFMVKLLDEAIPVLPWKLGDTPDSNDQLDDLSNWDGRFTKAAAMMLKAKILCFAASPLFNSAQPYYGGNTEAEQKHYVWYGGYKPELWEQCRKACEDFFQTNASNGNYYALVQADGTTPGKYRAAFRKAYATRGTTEMLLSTRIRYTTNNNDWNYLFHSWNGNGGYTPTLEFMEMFSWKDGRPFNYDQLEKEGRLDDMFMDSKYNLTRDPRLYETIIVNNMQMSLNDNGDMSGRHAELWVMGREAGANPKQENGMYATGFANNKFYMYDDSRNKPTLWPYLRLSDMYLIYAEALAQTGNYDKAVEEVDVVRKRVGLKGLKESEPGKNFSDKNTLIEAILRERACELGLEDTRLFDMIRYKRKDLFMKPLHGLRISRLDDNGQVLEASWSDKKVGEVGYSPTGPIRFKYERFPLTNVRRAWWTTFDEKWYLSPFPPTEVNKGYGLVQNPGW